MSDRKEVFIVVFSVRSVKYDFLTIHLGNMFKLTLDPLLNLVKNKETQTGLVNYFFWEVVKFVRVKSDQVLPEMDIPINSLPTLVLVDRKVETSKLVLFCMDRTVLIVSLMTFPFTLCLIISGLRQI